MFVIAAGAYPKVDQLYSLELSGSLGTNALAYLAFLSLIKGIGYLVVKVKTFFFVSEKMVCQEWNTQG